GGAASAGTSRRRPWLTPTFMAKTMISTGAATTARTNPTPVSSRIDQSLKLENMAPTTRSLRSPNREPYADPPRVAAAPAASLTWRTGQSLLPAGGEGPLPLTSPRPSPRERRPAGADGGVRI